MRITIDNLDGKGPRDYSAAISADGPLKIERVLNQPSRCTGDSARCVCSGRSYERAISRHRMRNASLQ